MNSEIEDIITDTKTLRKDIDQIIQRLKNVTSLDPDTSGADGEPAIPMGYRDSPERQESLVKLKEAAMWLGMDLKAIGEEHPGFVSNPYPHSKDPSTTRIDPTADGLKM